MRGRKPKPTQLKILQGNPGLRPLNVHEPQPAPLDTDCPAELSDPDARAEWTRTIAPAIEIGQITSADRMLAIAYCELWATWRSQLVAAAQHAHIIAVGSGKAQRPKANPAREMANSTLDRLLRIAAELGLSPTARSRIQVTPKAPRVNNPLAKFMKGFGTG